jgi:twinkle protein
MLHDKHKEWIEARGLSAELAEKLGISTRHDADGYWISVPYVERGKTVNHKYRQTMEKRHRMDANAPLCLWNHDVLLDAPEGATVVITEGEWDAMAAIMAGQPYVLSVPNGAVGETSEGPIDPDNDRFRYIWRSRDLLDRVGTFILATDSDEPGRVLAAELARRLGPERCKFIEYPWGSGGPMKDLNEVLQAFGVTAVSELLNSARSYPVKGLFRIRDFPDPGPMQVIPIGIHGLRDLVNIVPGTLSVLTGYPGQGKTTLTMVMVANMIRNRIAVCLATFETQPKPVLMRRLRACIAEAPEFQISDTAAKTADKLMDEYLSVIAQMVGEDDEMGLEEILERARIAVLRDGAKLLILDPWNEIEHKRRSDESETEYTNRAIRAVKHFMRQYQVAVWIVAHPAKPGINDSKRRVPGLTDISGSMHWANKPDYGIVCTRPNKESNVAEIHVTKVRMGLPGREGKVALEYDYRSSSYLESVC